MGDDANFCCPITTEPFTDPVVIIECGHTFDRQVLNELENKKCPTCNADFIDDPDDLPTNWIVASCLDLSIKQGECKKYTAEQARKDTQKAHFLEIRPFYEKILDDCKKYALKGFYGFNFNSKAYFGDIEPNIKDRIFERIREDGYKVTKLKQPNKWDYNISW